MPEPTSTRRATSCQVRAAAFDEGYVAFDVLPLLIPGPDGAPARAVLLGPEPEGTAITTR